MARYATDVRARVLIFLLNATQTDVGTFCDKLELTARGADCLFVRCVPPPPPPPPQTHINNASFSPSLSSKSTSSSSSSKNTSPPSLPVSSKMFSSPLLAAPSLVMPAHSVSEHLYPSANTNASTSTSTNTSMCNESTDVYFQHMASQMSTIGIDAFAALRV